MVRTIVGKIYNLCAIHVITKKREMSNYITKEELAADLIKIYTAAKRKVVKEGSTMEDKQGKRVSASFTVM